MEECNKGNCNGENGSGINNEGLSSIPIPRAVTFRQCYSATRVSPTRRKTYIRHPSLAKTSEIPIESLTIANCESEFLPIVRSGAWTDIGFRSSMEDVCVCVDDFMHRYGLEHISEGPNAFYGVFDGHGGRHAANFACIHLPRFIFENKGFPGEIEMVITSAFLQTDHAFAEACLLDAELASGTTALAALVLGSTI